MRYILRLVAWTIWLLALGISVALAWQFHGGDNIVALSIAILALGLSAFGVIFARDALQRRDWFASACGALLWAAGAVFFTITEIGYWDSSYNQHYTEFQQVKTAKARADGLDEQKWKALTTGDIPAAPAQIQAQINAAKMNDRWTATKQCAEPTTQPSKDFCRSFFQLQEKLAVAEQRVSLEAQFSKGIAEKQGHVVHNLLAGAEVLARRFKIDERLAADIVIFAAWALLLLSRDLGGVVANPLGSIRKPQEARTAAKAFDPISVASAPVQPVLPLPAAPRSPMIAMEKLTGVKAAPKSPEIPDSSIGQDSPNLDGEGTGGNHPDGPGTPIAKPEPKVEEVAEESRKVVSLFRDTGQLPEAGRGKKKAHKPEGKVESWLGESTSQVDNPSIKVGSEACWKSYFAWCEATGKQPMGRKLFSRKLNVLLGQKTGKGRKRDKNGSVFTGLMINPVMVQARRRVA